MNRSPNRFLRMPPSPRTASVTSRPRTPGGDVGEARGGMAPEWPLGDASAGPSIRYPPPALELANPVRRLASVQLGHGGGVEHPPADPRVAEMRLPRVLLSDVGESRGDSA